MEFVTFNTTGNATRKKKDGRWYVVVNAVLLTHSVHNGSNGPLYYPDEELGKTPQDWNDLPLVLYHPKGEDGKPTTANNKDVLEKTKLGFNDNTSYSGKLKSKLWFDEAETNKKSPEILVAINAGKSVELSTGLGMQIEEKTGTFNGKSYKGVARSYKPDHIAILPDLVGACSLKDGCGANVDNHLTVNDASFQRVQSALSEAIYKQFGYTHYVRDVYNGFFIYQDGNRELYQQTYSLNDDGKVALGKEKPVAVQWVTEYRTKDGGKFVGNCAANKCQCNSPETQNMDKTQIIAALLTNGTWKPEDKAWLEQQDVNVLNKLAAASPKPVANGLLPAPQTPPVVPAPAVGNMSVEQWVANSNMPLEVQKAILAPVFRDRAAKQQLVANIIAQPNNRFPQAWLEQQDVEMLQHLSSITQQPATPAQPSYNYGGMGLLPAGTPQTANVGVPILMAPDIVTAAETK